MTTIRERNHYEVLEVSSTATTDEIRAAFARLSELWVAEQSNPTGGGDANAHQALHDRRKEAMEILCDSDLRAVYDMELAEAAGQPVAPAPAISPPAARAATPPAPPLPVAAPPSPDELPTALVPSRAQDNREIPPRASPPTRDSKTKMVAIPPDAAFDGELLRRIRQAKGVNLQQLSEKTRIGVKHLENVESEKFDALPATVYLRGILMNLSKELGLDGIKVSKQYLERVQANRGKG